MVRQTGKIVMRVVAQAAEVSVTTVSNGVRVAACCVREGLQPPRILRVGHRTRERPQTLTDSLDRPKHPTALIAPINGVALKALHCLSQSGYAVSGEVSPIDYDIYAWMKATLLPRTFIRQPVDNPGVQSWARLILRLAGESTAPVQVRLSCMPAVRGSAAPPEKGSMQ